jgi:Helix-turn-helix domain
MAKPLFKKIPVTMRDHLSEITGNELKVWLYLLLRTGKENTSFPSNKLIADEIKLDRETVKTAKRNLRGKGWSKREYQRRREDGSLSTVVEKTIMPWLGNTATEVEKASHGAVAVNIRGGKMPPTEGTYNKPQGTVSPIQGDPEGSVLADGEQGSKQASSAVADFAVPRPSDVSQNQPDVLGVLPETEATPKPDLPQDREEMYENHLDSVECDLLHRISPNVTDVMVQDQFPLCAKILSHFNGAPEELQPAAAELVLKYNRAHRSGKYASKDDKKLYLRTAKQFLAALESPSASLMNDYDTHELENCETCQNAGCGMHWRKFVQEVLAERERERLAAVEAERQHAEEARRLVICPKCDKRERGKMTLGGFKTLLSGGLREVRQTVCDQCYDEAYEFQQKNPNMRVREVLSPRPEYAEAKRRAEMNKLV